MPAKTSNQTLEAADRFHSAAIHALRHVRREDPATGLGAARLSALSVLVFGGPRTLGELAAAEQVRPPTMTSIVRALESGGYVRRGSDPNDGGCALGALVGGAALPELESARELSIDCLCEAIDLSRSQVPGQRERRQLRVVEDLVRPRTADPGDRPLVAE